MPKLPVPSVEELINIFQRFSYNSFFMLLPTFAIYYAPRKILVLYKGSSATLQYPFIIRPQGPKLVHFHREKKTNLEKGQVWPMIADSFEK